MDLKTKYEDFVNIKGRVVNPLNIASNQKRQPRSGAIEPMWTVPKKEFIPVSDLKHLPSPTKNNCKFYLAVFFSVFKTCYILIFTYLAYSGLALKENADKTFYLAYDLLPKDNPAFHHEDHYSFDMVEGQNKLRTPQINNITLKVRLERQNLKCTFL